jgi:hypothetical protein
VEASPQRYEKKELYFEKNKKKPHKIKKLKN